MKGMLVLEDGSIFPGKIFGSERPAEGEAVFNTSLTGYQEIMTDPSYKGQIVCMTNPHIGNYGINIEDNESSGPQVEGLIVREYSRISSNFRSTETLESHFIKHGLVGLTGVDTRALTRRIREHGAMRSIIWPGENEKEALERVKEIPSMEGLDLASRVTCKEKHQWVDGYTSEFASKALKKENTEFNVAVLDFGVKQNILRSLCEIGAILTVWPANTTAETILNEKPDGVFLSNGPGDPAAVTYAVETIKQLAGKVPIFGICLGHQLISLAMGGKTYKLKFGHRGGNHPVKDLKTEKIEITSQNHGFAVDSDSLEDTGLKVSHLNLNDNTVEGLVHKEYPMFSVQYHPEASPGPHDSLHLFQRFGTLMKNNA